jgi:DNA-directed RNA polymerase specialized sigma24 family protein
MDDGEVVAAITAGDPGGLAAAYDTYAAPLYGYCRWMLRDPGQAAEVLRDTFAAAAAKLVTRDAGHLRAWLYATARDDCYRRLRTAEPGFDEGEDAGPEGAGARTEQAVVRRVLREILADLRP